VPRYHVLFLGTQNACRSQMAEGWLRAMSEGQVRVSSAGTRPGTVSPMTVATMAEAGIDIAAQRAKGLSDVDGPSVTHLITVSDLAAAEVPSLSRDVVRRHWPVPDPSEMEDEFRHLLAEGFRAVRDNLRDRARMFLVELGVAPVDVPPPAIDSAGGAA